MALPLSNIVMTLAAHLKGGKMRSSQFEADEQVEMMIFANNTTIDLTVSESGEVKMRVLRDGEHMGSFKLRGTV